MQKDAKNVLGGELKSCCTNPMTGFYRDGFCHTGEDDMGRHLICVELNEEFLHLGKYLGNDLMTPRPEFQFPGLKPGDRWCVCANRWLQCLQEDMNEPPKIDLEATHEKMLDFIDLETLKKYAL